MEIKAKRKLRKMPFDKVFYTDNGRENCHATGYEVCDGDIHNPADWWNEYEDSECNLHYGR